jgi:hypothetical protein
MLFKESQKWKWFTQKFQMISLKNGKSFLTLYDRDGASLKGKN